MDVNNKNIYLCNFCFSLLKIKSCECYKCEYSNKSARTILEFCSFYNDNEYYNIKRYLDSRINKTDNSMVVRTKVRNLIRLLKWVGINYEKIS